MGELGPVLSMNGNVELSGSLNFLPLGDVLQFLGSSGSTGVLRLVNRFAAQPGFVYFNAGQPINAQNGELEGLEALYSLFGWVEGSFEFTRQPPGAEKRITKSRMGIILEGMKLLDDGHTETVGPHSIGAVKSAPHLSGPRASVVKGPLVDYMYVVDEEDFFDGEHIVEEGKHGNWVWVILEGVVDIVKEQVAGTIPIVRLGDGSFIGSMASFLLQGHMRTASAVAVGNVQLGVLDSQRLAQEYAGMSYEFRGVLTSLDKRLKQLTNRVVEQRSGAARMDNQLTNGNVLVHQGDSTTKKAFFIRQGQATVVRETDKGQLLLCQLGPGDFFGNLPFLYFGHEPESASVYGAEDIEVLEVSPSVLTQEYHRLSTTFKNIVDNMATCMLVTADLLRGAARGTKRSGGRWSTDPSTDRNKGESL